MKINVSWQSNLSVIAPWLYYHCNKGQYDYKTKQQYFCQTKKQNNPPSKNPTLLKSNKNHGNFHIANIYNSETGRNDLCYAAVHKYFV